MKLAKICLTCKNKTFFHRDPSQIKARDVCNIFVLRRCAVKLWVLFWSSMCNVFYFFPNQRRFNITIRTVVFFLAFCAQSVHATFIYSFTKPKSLKGRSIRTILWISENSKSALDEFCWTRLAKRNTHTIYQFQIFCITFPRRIWKQKTN